jgi:hypothetical protein
MSSVGYGRQRSVPAASLHQRYTVKLAAGGYVGKQIGNAPRSAGQACANHVRWSTEADPPATMARRWVLQAPSRRPLQKAAVSFRSFAEEEKRADTCPRRPRGNDHRMWFPITHHAKAPGGRSQSGDGRQQCHLVGVRSGLDHPFRRHPGMRVPAQSSCQQPRATRPR